MKIHVFKNGPLKQNCYIVASKCHKCVVIDPGSDPDGIAEIFDELCLKPVAVICTHGHFDHIGAVFELQERYKIPFYLNKKDYPLVKRANLYQLVSQSKIAIKIPKNYTDLTEHRVIVVDELEFEVLDTPGHTDGSVCIKVKNSLFTGDTILKKKAGRFDMVGGNQKALSLSIKKLVRGLPGSITCYGGHGEPFELQTLHINALSES